MQIPKSDIVLMKLKSIMCSQNHISLFFLLSTRRRQFTHFIGTIPILSFLWDLHNPVIHIHGLMEIRSPHSPYQSFPVSLPVSPCTLEGRTHPGCARPRSEGRAAAKKECNYHVSHIRTNQFKRCLEGRSRAKINGNFNFEISFALKPASF